jgi:hypothetical protein
MNYVLKFGAKYSTIWQQESEGMMKPGYWIGYLYDVEG